VVQTGNKDKPFPHVDRQAMENAAQRGYAVSVLGGSKTQLDQTLNNSF